MNPGPRQRRSHRRPQPSAHRRPYPDPARRAAYDVLHEVGAGDAYANLYMRSLFAELELDGRDAGFATELVFGVLRNRSTLDAVLAACVDRPLAKLDPRILDILRLGAYQLLYLRTAAHAAVGSSVDLAADVVGPAPKGLVNAVLRKVAAKDLETWLAQLTSGLTRAKALAVRTSHPAWIVSSLRDALGGDDDALRELLEHNNTPPAVTLAARPGRITVAKLSSQAGDRVRPGRWSPYALVLTDGRPGSLAAVRAQHAGVQDEGSQVMALLLANADLDGRDERWLDMCAGPGGKAGLLAGLAAERGARLLASDVHLSRATLVAKTLAQAPGAHAVVQADGRSGPWAAGTFDRILLDAPCTGLGVLRRRPEARWRRTPADVSALTDLQTALLDSAITALRPGGVVAYVTCSPHIAETDLIVDRALSKHKGEIVESDSKVGLPEDLAATLDPGLRTRLWPHRHDTDGMFAAVLRKV